MLVCPTGGGRLSEGADVLLGEGIRRQMSGEGRGQMSSFRSGGGSGWRPYDKCGCARTRDNAARPPWTRFATESAELTVRECRLCSLHLSYWRRCRYRRSCCSERRR